MKHETGLPGKPKKYLFFENFPNVVGFPGLIETLSNKIFIFRLHRTFFTKSYFPREIPPDVMRISKSLSFLINFSNSSILSFTI